MPRMGDPFLVMIWPTEPIIRSAASLCSGCFSSALHTRVKTRERKGAVGAGGRVLSEGGINELEDAIERGFLSFAC